MGSIPRYLRSYGPRMSWGRMLTPAIRNIIIARAGVFLVQTLLNLFAPLTVQRLSVAYRELTIGHLQNVFCKMAPGVWVYN